MKNQMNLSSSPFNVHYWMIEDTALAENLGMSTSEENVGDVYVLRKDSVYTDGKKSNLQLDGYPYISEKVQTSLRHPYMSAISTDTAQASLRFSKNG